MKMAKAEFNFFQLRFEIPENTMNVLSELKKKQSWVELCVRLRSLRRKLPPSNMVVLHTLNVGQERL